MFAVFDDDNAAIRAASDAGGELAAAVEFRRRFRGITDNDEARDWARRIVARPPLAAPIPPNCPVRDAKHVASGGLFAAQDAPMIGGGEIDAAARITTKALM
jgi:hypothetical protein